MQKSPIYQEIKEKTITLLLGGFSFVAALAWNEAVKALFDELFPAKGTLIAKFLYAIVVTVSIVILSKYFLRQSKED